MIFSFAWVRIFSNFLLGRHLLHFLHTISRTRRSSHYRSKFGCCEHGRFLPFNEASRFSTFCGVSLLNELSRHIPTWAPFSDFKVKALETRKAVEAMMEIPFEQVKVDMVSIGLWKHMWRKDSPHHSSRDREPLFRRIHRRCWVPSVILMAIYRPKMRRISKGRLERCLLVQHLSLLPQSDA